MMTRTILVVVLALFAPTLARADEPPPAPEVIARARALNDRGRAAHDAGDYPTAIAAFKEAYVLAPSAGVLFNLAQAYRLHGDCADAALMYRRFLASSPNADGREVAAMHLAAVERCATPVPTIPPPLAPGHAVLVESRVTGESPAPQPGRTQRRAGVVLAIAGVALLATSLYFEVEAHDAASDVSHFYATGGAWTAIAPTDARGHRDADWADGLAIGGGLTAIAGTALYALGHRAEHEPPIALSVSAHGAHASLSWQF